MGGAALTGVKGGKDMFDVDVTVKQAGKRKDWLDKQPYRLEKRPETVEELIEQTVLACVAEHNARLTRTEAPLSQEEAEGMAELGKIAFGLLYGDRAADAGTAIQTAIEGYRDGLFRIFLNDRLLEGLEDDLDMREGDHLIFVRLVMLAGRRW